MSRTVAQRGAAQRKGDSSSCKVKKEQLYAEARKRGDAAVKQGVTFIEDAKDRLAALKEQEVSFEKQLAAFEPLVEAQASAFEHLIALYPPMLEEVGARRAERLNSASKFNQTTQAKREASARKISREARKQLEEANQRAHVATDATNLIKSLKATVRF